MLLQIYSGAFCHSFFNPNHFLCGSIKDDRWIIIIFVLQKQRDEPNAGEI